MIYFLITLALVLAVLIASYSLIGTVRRSIRHQKLKSKLLKNIVSEESVPKIMQAKRRTNKEGKLRSFRIPIISCIVDDLKYLGVGSLAWPAALSCLSLSWPLSQVIPISYLPHAVPFTISLVLTTILTGGVFRSAAGRIKSRIDADLPIFLDSVARGLRVGKSFEKTLSEATAMIGPHLRRSIDEIRAGIAVGFPASDLFEEQARKNQVDSFYFIAAVVGASESANGEQATAIESLSRSIRSRRDIKLKIASESGQGKIGGYLITCMPLGLMLLMPEIVKHLFTNQIGNITLTVIFILLFASYLTINKIVNLKV